MKLKGEQVLKIINDYFGNGQSDLSSMDIFWLLIFPCFILILILIYWFLRKRQNDSNDNRSLTQDERERQKITEQVDSDFTLIESIALQKGLETSECDFIIELCIKHRLVPQKALLDKSTYEKLEEMCLSDSQVEGLDVDNKTVKSLASIKSKLFL